MKKLVCILIIALTAISCSNKKHETSRVSEIGANEKQKVPAYESSKYASIGDTLLINHLQIILDSAFIRKIDVGENPVLKQIYAKRNSKMLHAYVKITNIGNTVQDLPYVDQIEEIRKRTDINNTHRFKTNKQNDTGFRLGSRAFILLPQHEFKVSIKPKQTITGLYTTEYKPYQFSALSFWYNLDNNVEVDSQMMSVIVEMAKSYKIEGKPIFSILMKDAKINDVGFDITEIINKSKEE